MTISINPETGIKVFSSLGTFFFQDWNYFLDYLVDTNSPIRLEDYNLKVFHKSTVIFVETLSDNNTEGGFNSDYIGNNYREIENLKLLPPEILRQQFPDLYNPQYTDEFDSTQSPKISMIQTQPNVIYGDFIKLPPIC
ncbi:hypothetical protein [Laspinema olomoucense]|uniref:hypothetical protein n=1 Tax=Laspinema olomoucense TaxID=3231600 RepID=UPI0021BAFEEB|nr:hypothetical protein [Laspinema sp. D3d]MCT7971270.1 hypothetical protein [Laspinema sp. D3d]